MSEGRERERKIDVGSTELVRIFRLQNNTFFSKIVHPKGSYRAALTSVDRFLPSQLCLMRQLPRGGILLFLLLIADIY